MISNINDIYENAAQKHNLDPKMVKSIGVTVFAHLKDKMLDLDESSIFLRGVGGFVLKSIKVEKQLHRYLSMRRKFFLKDKKHVDRPVGGQIKKLFKLYLTRVLKFKKLKREMSTRQVEFCKTLYESYETKPDKSITTNKYTSDRPELDLDTY